MSVFGRDESNYDGDSRHDGMTFMTHKATEGTTVVHDRYGPRLNEWRAAGVPVLGAYHVVRTPGSGGHGSLAAQLAFWLGYLDAQTPWWRSHPAFILQVDAETWTYDAVSAGNVKAFATLLVGAGVPGWKVTYASRGQYGDRLAGIATPLWNADYRGSVGGSYPGDGWTTQQGQAAGWAPYSGQRPALLQFASTPHDLDAFPGTQAALVALIQGDTMQEIQRLADNGDRWGLATVTGSQPAMFLGSDGKPYPTANLLHTKLDAIAAAVTAPVALTGDQVMAIGAQVATAVAEQLTALTAAVDALTARVAAAGHALES